MVPIQEEVERPVQQQEAVHRVLQALGGGRSTRAGWAEVVAIEGPVALGVESHAASTRITIVGEVQPGSAQYLELLMEEIP